MQISTTRRALLAAAAATLTTPGNLRAAEPSVTIARGTVKLQNGELAVGSGAPGAALYVTAKPDAGVRMRYKFNPSTLT